jgi:hypothetical protein
VEQIARLRQFIVVPFETIAIACSPTTCTRFGVCQRKARFRHALATNQEKFFARACAA